MPLAPPAPIVLPALGEAAKDLVVGAIETLALPLIVLDYLISPNSGGNTGYRDTTDAPGGPPPSTSQQGTVNPGPINTSNSAVDKVVDKIDKGGFEVKANPKSPGQEGNVTISHPSQPGSRVNVRVETHALKPGGKPVRHANVERVEPGAKNRPVVVSNTHITE
jgi:hypothetical protein